MINRFPIVRTLIVDDSEAECQLLRAQLGQVGAIRIVRFAHNGLEAMSYLWGAHEFGDRVKFPYPDLMLLDLNMPKCNGMDVLQMLRYEPVRPWVVLWSSALRPRDVEFASHLGADLVCAKPNNLRELGNILEQLVEKVSKQDSSFPDFDPTYVDNANGCNLNSSLGAPLQSLKR